MVTPNCTPLSTSSSLRWSFSDGAGAAALGLDELLDAGIADADQRKLGGHKERIGGNQEQHGQNSQ